MERINTMEQAIEVYAAEIERLRNRIAKLEDLNLKAFECLVKASMRANALEDELNKKHKVFDHEMRGNKNG